jgi:hypothetical protein
MKGESAVISRFRYFEFDDCPVALHQNLLAVCMLSEFVMSALVSVMGGADPAFLYFGFCMPVSLSQLAREHTSA